MSRMTTVNGSANDEFVELEKVQGDFEAQVLRSLLESEGIDVIVKAGLVHTVHPLTVDGLGEVRVCVRDGDVPRAREILDAFRERR
jgi:hypothetical protein